MRLPDGLVLRTCEDPPHGSPCRWLEAERGRAGDLVEAPPDLPCSLGQPGLPWERPDEDEAAACALLARGRRLLLTLHRPPGAELDALLPGSASLELPLGPGLEATATWAAKRELTWLFRLGPLIAGLDDDLARLEELLEQAAARGARRVLAGSLVVDPMQLPRLREHLAAAGLVDRAADDCLRLATRELEGRDYRHRLYGLLRSMCDRFSLGFAVQELGAPPGVECNRFLASIRSCCRNCEGRVSGPTKASGPEGASR